MIFKSFRSALMNATSSEDDRNDKRRYKDRKGKRNREKEKPLAHFLKTLRPFLDLGVPKIDTKAYNFRHSG